MRDFDRVVKWVREGTVDAYKGENEATSYVQWLKDDETAFQVALKYIDSGEKFTWLQDLTLWQVVNTT